MEVLPPTFPAPGRRQRSAAAVLTRTSVPRRGAASQRGKGQRERPLRNGCQTARRRCPGKSIDFQGKLNQKTQKPWIGFTQQKVDFLADVPVCKPILANKWGNHKTRSKARHLHLLSGRLQLQQPLPITFFCLLLCGGVIRIVWK